MGSFIRKAKSLTVEWLFQNACPESHEAWICVHDIAFKLKGPTGRGLCLVYDSAKTTVGVWAPQVPNMINWMSVKAVTPA